MEQTEKQKLYVRTELFNALTRVYRDIKYDYPDSIGYPFDMIYDIIMCEDQKIMLMFIKREYFSSYTLIPFQKLSNFDFFRAIETYGHVIIKFNDQVLTYSVAKEKESNEYLYKVLQVLYDVSYQNLREKDGVEYNSHFFS